MNEYDVCTNPAQSMYCILHSPRLTLDGQIRRFAPIAQTSAEDRTTRVDFSGDLANKVMASIVEMFLGVKDGVDGAQYSCDAWAGKTVYVLAEDKLMFPGLLLTARPENSKRRATRRDQSV